LTIDREGGPLRLLGKVDNNGRQGRQRATACIEGGRPQQEGKADSHLRQRRHRNMEGDRTWQAWKAEAAARRECRQPRQARKADRQSLQGPSQSYVGRRKAMQA